MVNCALSEVAYMRVVFLRVKYMCTMISQQWSLHHPFIITWPIVLLPAVRPRPTRLNTPDHVACELKSTTRATSQSPIKPRNRDTEAR